MARSDSVADPRYRGITKAVEADDPKAFALAVTELMLTPPPVGTPALSTNDRSYLLGIACNWLMKLAPATIKKTDKP